MESQKITATSHENFPWVHCMTCLWVTRTRRGSLWSLRFFITLASRLEKQLKKGSIETYSSTKASERSTAKKVVLKRVEDYWSSILTKTAWHLQLLYDSIKNTIATLSYNMQRKDVPNFIRKHKVFFGPLLVNCLVNFWVKSKTAPRVIPMTFWVVELTTLGRKHWAYSKTDSNSASLTHFSEFKLTVHWITRSCDVPEHAWRYHVTSRHSTAAITSSHEISVGLVIYQGCWEEPTLDSDFNISRYEPILGTTILKACEIYFHVWSA